MPTLRAGVTDVSGAGFNSTLPVADGRTESLPPTPIVATHCTLF
ncbi:MAG: hypothetical protein ACT4NL_14700 [Pseudomarimonas sp.]